MPAETLRIGLASPRLAPAREAAVETVGRCLAEAAARDVAVVCFPETFLPGYRGDDFPAPPPDQPAQERALREVRALARAHRVAVILPLEWSTAAGLLNLAVVIDADGALQGWQVKTQVAPEEEPYYVPGQGRRLFSVDGVPFGIVICHEGFRYPETVRWAAQRGARVVFHPHLAGSDQQGVVPRHWGDPDAPYYEKAMILRAVENEIFFASVNYAFHRQESATSLIAPDGRCLAHTPYGEEALLVSDLDLAAATGQYARRFAPERFAGAPADDLRLAAPR